MERSALTIELAALEKAGKITPNDRNEVEKFADLLAKIKEAKAANDPRTLGQIYDDEYEAGAATGEVPQ